MCISGDLKFYLAIRWYKTVSKLILLHGNISGMSVLWALAVIFIVQSTEGCHSVNIILCVTVVYGHMNKHVLNIIKEFKLENIERTSNSTSNSVNLHLRLCYAEGY